MWCCPSSVPCLREATPSLQLPGLQVRHFPSPWAPCYPHLGAHHQGVYSCLPSLPAPQSPSPSSRALWLPSNNPDVLKLRLRLPTTPPRLGLPPLHCSFLDGFLGPPTCWAPLPRLSQLPQLPANCSPYKSVVQAPCCARILGLPTWLHRCCPTEAPSQLLPSLHPPATPPWTKELSHDDKTL